MGAEGQTRQRSFIAQTVITVLLSWAWWKALPYFSAGPIEWAIWTLGLLAAIYGVEVVCRALLALANAVEWIGINRATGKDGTADFASFKEIAHELLPKHSGPFWGMAADGSGKPLFADFSSNAFCIGPSGSGKGICVTVMNLLLIHCNKVLQDFKGDLLYIVKDVLEERGERVVIVNPFRVWVEKLGEGVCLNPLDLITKCLYVPGGIKDVYDILRELSMQLVQEMSEGQTDHTFFRDGSRDIIIDVALILIIIFGYEASIPMVAQLIHDRRQLEYHLGWVAGRGIDGKPLPNGPMPIELAEWAKLHTTEAVKEFVDVIRARCKAHLDLMSTTESKSFEAFLSGAQKALAPYAYGRMADCLRQSTFDINEMKNSEQTITLGYVGDAGKPEATSMLFGLLGWYFLTAMKMHPNKKKKNYVLWDEATISKVFDLQNLLVYGRAYGLRLLLIFQDWSAFRRVYGDAAAQTLWSESEIKQVLPGQRNEATLEMISSLLGNKSHMAQNFSKGSFEEGAGVSVSEVGRPIMTKDEIRRTDKGILIIRRCKPKLFEPVSYAEAAPFRDVVDENPFHPGEPFKKKIKLRLKVK